MSILIKDVLLNNKVQDIFVEDNKITKIGNKLNENAECKINGKNKAAIPSFINSHTHAAMTLMRGYADDMVVLEWLQKKIWPLEGKLTNKDLYWGTKLACLEMIKSGTTFFNDMYFFKGGDNDAIQAAVESGIRMMAGHVLLDFDPANRKKEWHIQSDITNYVKNLNNPRISVAINPHSIYAVSEESLLWCKEFANKNNLLLHIHLCESKQEVEDCKKKHGKTPVEYLNNIGFLGPNVISAHNIWVNQKEIEILKKHDVKTVHTPVSNMKLSSGVFPYKEMKKAGLTISLGTDGCASNNNLDMFEEMKATSILHKLKSMDPTLTPGNEAFEMATINGAKAFGLNTGIIEEGKLADLLLIDLKKPFMVPLHNLISNIVFAANGSCVDTTICDGKILMQNRKVKGEEEILEKAAETAKDLVSR